MVDWNKYVEKDENGEALERPGFVELKAEGDEFEGVLTAVDERTFEAGYFSHQKEDITVPSLTFKKNSREYKLDLLATVLRNEVIEAAPDLGNTVKIIRGKVPRGKRYPLFTVKVRRAEDSSEAAPKKAEPKSKAKAPADDEVDF